MDNEILKQNILTKQDFVGILLDELHNSGFLGDKSEEEIELITNTSNFELIQKHHGACWSKTWDRYPRC